MEALLRKIKESPASFGELYDFELDTYSEPKIHCYKKNFVVEGKTVFHEWLGEVINYLFYPEDDGEVNIDVRVEARFVPKQSEHNFTTFDKELEWSKPLKDGSKPKFETESVKLEILRFSKYLTIQEYNDECVFDFLGVEIWKTDWEIPYKEEQIRNFRESIEREIESVLEY